MRSEANVEAISDTIGVTLVGNWAFGEGETDSTAATAPSLTSGPESGMADCSSSLVACRGKIKAFYGTYKKYIYGICAPKCTYHKVEHCTHAHYE